VTVLAPDDCLSHLCDGLLVGGGGARGGGGGLLIASREEQGVDVVLVIRRGVPPVGHAANNTRAGDSRGDLLVPNDMLEPESLAVLPNIVRSEEHTSELQSRENLVCRLLLEKKK